MNQREIKFRAWELNTGYKVTGHYISCLDIAIEGSPRVNAIIDNRGHWSYVNPETVQQYTGLKDKNGKPIYEGDIINAETELKGDSQNLIVIYNPEYVGYTLTNQAQTDGAYLMNCEFWAEVIGNMYENPELLTPSQP